METVTVNVKCPACGKVYEIDVPKEQYDTYKAGALIQDAFPDMPCEIREMFITGICPPCWDRMFS